MEIREYKVYKFNELPPETQQKVIDNLWAINIEYDWWDSILDGYRDNFKNLIYFNKPYPFVESVEVKTFDFYPRNITLNITIDNPSFVNYTLGEKNGKRIMTLSDNGWLYSENEEYGMCQCYEKYPRISKLLTTLDQTHKEFKADIGHDILNDLQQQYEYLISKEAIRETIECNDYNFKTDGTLDY